MTYGNDTSKIKYDMDYFYFTRNFPNTNQSKGLIYPILGFFGLLCPRYARIKSLEEKNVDPASLHNNKSVLNYQP